MSSAAACRNGHPYEPATTRTTRGYRECRICIRARDSMARARARAANPRHLPSVEERFWAKVDRSRGPQTCWPWLGCCSGGYGIFGVNGENVRAHRFAYELLVGPIPEDKVLDHVRARGCTRTNCVNPAHLEPVTQAVNNLRGDSPTARYTRQTHCKRGHPFDEENTYRVRGRRECRTCRRLAKRRARCTRSTAQSASRHAPISATY